MNAAVSHEMPWVLMAGMERPGPPEESLIADARCRQPNALDDMVRRHQGKVFNLAYRMLRQREDAEDVSQEAFLKAFESLPRLRNVGSFGPWVCRIAANLCLARLRSGPRSIEVATDPGRLLEVSGGKAPDVVAAENIRSAVGLLPPKYRLAVVAFYREGRSYEEAARLVGVPVRTFKTRLYRARKMLRRMLVEGKSG